MKKPMLFCLLLLFSTTAKAVSPEKSKALDASQQEHSFEDLLVQGKYHFSDEAVTTVEEDKVLDGLIGMRKDFKDRIEKSANKF